MNPLKPKPIQSLLGLAIRGNRLTAAVAKRINGAVRFSSHATVELSSPPWTDDPELVGQEIQAFLEQKEIRENRCLLCLPLNIAMTISVEIPDLSDGDLQSYLELQAESEFPFGIEDMQLASAVYRAPDQSRHATLAAIPKNRIEQIQQVLQHARLRPVSLVLGLAAAAAGDNPQLVLDVQPDHVDLNVRCGKGFAVIRSLEGVSNFAKDGGAQDCSPLCREIRITLGQLPGNLRQNLAAAICHSAEPSSAWRQSLERGLAGMGFQTAFREGQHSALEAAVKARLANQPCSLEFLPSKRGPFRIFAEKASSQHNVWIGGSVGTVVFLVVAVFYIQGWRLHTLEREWNGMAEKVKTLEAKQNKIRQFRLWYDNSAPSLQIVRQLAETFPKEGSVWLESIEIKGNRQVRCAGSARGNQDRLDFIDRLRAADNVHDIATQHVSGESTKQFAFHFVWEFPKGP